MLRMHPAEGAMIEPPDDALPPFEALDRFSDPALLKTFDPEWYLLSWWVKGFPNCQVTNPFFERLYREELVCWARHQSPAAPWSRIPGTAWRYLRVHWDKGLLWRLAEERPGGAEQWFDARIAQVNGFVHAIGGFSRTELRRFLEGHHAKRRAQGRRPTQRDDEEAAKRALPNAPREEVRMARRDVLSQEELRPGRPRKVK
jgi:hypothetical protein